MPQLPSGIHVAVDTLPLSETLRTWQLDASRETLARLRCIEDLYPLTRILELVPAQTGDEPLQAAANSMAPPTQMATRDTGFRLSDCPDGLNDWSAQDKAAFRDYLEQRVAGYLAAQLDEAMKQFAALSKAFIKKVEEAWLRAGVHPSQDPGWDDWPESPDIDVFDQLVALLQCWRAISTAAQGEVARSRTVERLQGFLSMAARTLHWLPEPMEPMAATAVLARTIRETVGPKAFPNEKRAWWEQQLSIECDNLFNDDALEQFLTQHAPKAYGVIRLSAISRGGGTPS